MNGKYVWEFFLGFRAKLPLFLSVRNICISSGLTTEKLAFSFISGSTVCLASSRSGSGFTGSPKLQFTRMSGISWPRITHQTSPTRTLPETSGLLPKRDSFQVFNGFLFRLEFFNATQWVELFERSGAKYAVLTSKHHEGYTLWPSPLSFSWNSMDVSRDEKAIAKLFLTRK